MKANNGWTPERRARQAELIRNWKPWEKSTGAKTEQGKAVSKMNAMRLTPLGLLKQAEKLCRAKECYFRGHHQKAWLVLRDAERYINERELKKNN
jgi:hypothetical protein